MSRFDGRGAIVTGGALSTGRDPREFYEHFLRIRERDCEFAYAGFVGQSFSLNVFFRISKILAHRRYWLSSNKRGFHPSFR